MPIAAKPIPTMTEKDKARFFSKLAIGDLNQCWNCAGDPHTGGYGKMKIGQRRHYMHRICWTIFFGVIPDGLFVCHNCPEGDTPSCCNPSHLWLGSHKENMGDMESKGRHRHPSGEESHRAKLNRVQVEEIRKLYSEGDLYQHQIAVLFGITQANVSEITQRKSWPTP